MTRTRWKLGVTIVLGAQLLFTAVGAVDASQCSNVNTGSGGKSSNSIYMTNGMCHDNCAGYAFAITQYQNCWCSNEAPGSTTSTGSCNQDCPGYPDEKCGNQQQGLFAYVALGKAPEGTMGAGGGMGSSTPAPSSAFVAPSSAPAPPPSTLVIVSSAAPQTIVQTQTPSQVSMPAPPSSSLPPAPVVITQTQQSTETQVSSIAPSTILQKAPTTVIEGPTSTVTPSPLVVTSAQAVTVSGSVVTHFITSTPTSTPAPSQAQANELPKQTKQGLSNGAVAGVTIGAIAGAALLAGAIFFGLWRRRKNQPSDSESLGPKRSTSVLSRVGLLGKSNTSDSHGPTLPRITTSGVGMDGGLDSAVTYGSSEMSDGRRNSRPLFSDTRLNPNALMTQTNLSRTSVSTLQDAHDYSRPLEVRNPDR